MNRITTVQMLQQTYQQQTVLFVKFKWFWLMYTFETEIYLEIPYLRSRNILYIFGKLIFFQNHFNTIH